MAGLESLENRLDFYRKRKRFFKISLTVLMILTVVLLILSLFGGQGGILCFFVFYLLPIFLPAGLVLSLLYFQNFNHLKKYNSMWDEFRQATIAQGLEPKKDAPGEIFNILKNSSLASYEVRYPIFGTKQKILGRTFWTFLWKSMYVKKDNQPSGREYLVALTKIPNLKGWITLRNESILDMEIIKKDIDFEDPEFSDKYYVKASSKRAAFDFFHPRMMELWKRHPFYVLNVQKGWVVIFKSIYTDNILPLGMLNSTYYVKPLLDFHGHGVSFLEQVVDLIPNYVKGKEKVEAVEFEDDPMEDVEFSEIIEL
jgi:hypothetical protein